MVEAFTTMLKYHFKFFVRSMQHHPLFAALNIGGLTLGLFTFIYLIDYISFESSFDAFRPDHNRIFRLTSQKIQDGMAEDRRSSASVYLAPFLRENFPEIKNVARVHILDNELQTVIVQNGETRKKFEETSGFHADEEYFSVFGDHLVMGNPKTAFSEPFNMVITTSTALKYFNSLEVYGRTVTLVDDEIHDYKITGVVADPPVNSHFRYDYLISLKTLETLWPYARWSAWNWDYFHTYIKLKEGVSMSSLEGRINQAVALAGKEDFESGNYEMTFSAQNIRDIHLESDLGRELSTNGDGGQLGYLSGIALIVLFLAWFNYINLTTATSTLRAKEIGIRKVSGAASKGLSGQFLLEALWTNLVSVVLAVVLVAGLSGYLELYTGHAFGWYAFKELSWLAIFLLVLGTGSLLSGGYPALVLSRFRPLGVLKGSFIKSRQGAMLRKVLVTFQFAVSLLLMMATLAIYTQVNYLKERDLGIDLEQVLAVHAPNIRTEQVWEEFDYLKEKTQRNAAVLGVSASNQVPGKILYHTELFKKKAQNVSEARVAGMVWVDYDYLDIYGLEMTSGKGFDIRHHENERGLVINEAMVKSMGFEDPNQAVGQPATWVHSFGALTELKILGVVNDFDQRPLGSAQPMAMLMNRHYRWREMGYYLFKIHSVNPGEVIADIRTHFEELYPNETFKSFFVDERFERAYHSEARFGDILTLFALLAIFICNLGLFGLTYFILTQKRKEISVRKVLGATVGQLLRLVSGQFVPMMILATALALPVAYFGLQVWLQRFVYRMEPDWIMFAVPFLTLVTIAMLATGWITRRAAMANPVHYLRNE